MLDIRVLGVVFLLGILFIGGLYYYFVSLHIIYFIVFCVGLGCIIFFSKYFIFFVAMLNCSIGIYFFWGVHGGVYISIVFMDFIRIFNYFFWI